MQRKIIIGSALVVALWGGMVPALCLASSEWSKVAAQDSVLQERVRLFNENFGANEQRLVDGYNREQRRIEIDQNLSESAKRQHLHGARKAYQLASTENVLRYRKPVSDRVLELANGEAMRRTGHKGDWYHETAQDTLGTSAGTSNRAGEIVANDKFRGARGDRDIGAGLVASKLSADLFQESGFRVEGGVSDTRLGGRTNSFDVPDLEFTANTNIDDVVGSRGRSRGYNKPGSSAHQSLVRSLVYDGETYSAISMADGQVAKSNSMVLNHLIKGARGRDVAPSVLLTDRDRRQLFAKGTLKAINAVNLSDAEISAQLRRHNVDLTVSQYRATLNGLYHDASPGEIGLNRANIKGFVEMTSATQDMIRAKVTADAAGALAREQANLDAQWARARQSEGNTPEKQALLSKYDELQDSRVRLAEEVGYLNQATNQAMDTRFGETSQPIQGKVTPLPAKVRPPATIRKTVNKVGGRYLVGGMKGLGVVGDAMTMYALSQGLYSSLSNGSYSQAAALAYDAAKEELSGRATSAVLQYIHPGVGQLLGAYDLGSTAGTLIGMIPVAEGATVNTEVQSICGGFIDYFNGVTQQERASMAISGMVAELKDGARLQAGMGTADAAEIIRNNIASNRLPMAGIVFATQADVARGDAVLELTPVASQEDIPLTLEEERHQAQADYAYAERLKAARVERERIAQAEAREQRLQQERTAYIPPATTFYNSNADEELDESGFDTVLPEKVTRRSDADRIDTKGVDDDDWSSAEIGLRLNDRADGRRGRSNSNGYILISKSKSIRVPLSNYKNEDHSYEATVCGHKLYASKYNYEKLQMLSKQSGYDSHSLQLRGKTIATCRFLFGHK